MVRVCIGVIAHRLAHDAQRAQQHPIQLACETPKVLEALWEAALLFA